MVMVDPVTSVVWHFVGLWMAAVWHTLHSASFAASRSMVCDRCSIQAFELHSQLVMPCLLQCVSVKWKTAVEMIVKQNSTFVENQIK